MIKIKAKSFDITDVYGTEILAATTEDGKTYLSTEQAYDILGIDWASLSSTQKNQLGPVSVEMDTHKDKSKPCTVFPIESFMALAAEEIEEKRWIESELENLKAQRGFGELYDLRHDEIQSTHRSKTAHNEAGQEYQRKGYPGCFGKERFAEADPLRLSDALSAHARSLFPWVVR